MASLALGTAILAGADARKRGYLAGATVAAGDVVYVDGDGRVRPARSNALSTSRVIGVALNGGAALQPVEVLLEGTLTATATLVVGEAYFVSNATAGQVYPSGDIAATHFLGFVGLALTATSLHVNPVSIGVARA